MKKLIILMFVVGCMANVSAQTNEIIKRLEKANKKSAQETEKTRETGAKAIDTAKQEVYQGIDQVKEEVKNVETNGVEEVKKLKSENIKDEVSINITTLDEEKIEMTAERAENATTKAKAKSEIAVKRVKELEESVAGIEDKIVAAKERVQFALDNKDITAKAAEVKFSKIKEAEAKVEAIKTQITDQKSRIESLNKLIGN